MRCRKFREHRAKQTARKNHDIRVSHFPSQNAPALLSLLYTSSRSAPQFFTYNPHPAGLCCFRVGLPRRAYRQPGGRLVFARQIRGLQFRVSGGPGASGVLQQVLQPSRRGPALEAALRPRVPLVDASSQRLVGVQRVREGFQAAIRVLL